MFEHISKRTAFVIAAGTVGSSALFGCSGGSTNNGNPSASPSAQPSYKVSQTCTPKAGTWEQAPSGLNTTRFITALGQGVTASEINKGTIGNAECPKGITGNDIQNAAPGSVIAVTGHGALCLAIGENTGPGAPLPQGTQAYTDVIAVCPSMGEGA